MGIMMGKLTSQDPGPGLSTGFSLGFLVRIDTDPKGAYDCPVLIVQLYYFFCGSTNQLPLPNSLKSSINQTRFGLSVRQEADIDLPFTVLIQLQQQYSTTTMDISDFSHNYKYKFIIPSIYIISWGFMFIGPMLFQVTYQKVCLALLIYITLKSVVILLIAIFSFFKSKRIIDRAQEIQKNKILSHVTNAYCSEVYHAFIIPSYRQDDDLLDQTINRIASHQGSKANYMIFLAMEAHEQNSDLKADRLIQINKNKFLMMGYTQHHLKEYQQRGKASNVSWCVQHLQQLYFRPNNIPLQKILLTIIDADSWVPQAYVREIDDHLLNHIPNRQRYIYQSNQIYTRNHLDVPIITRVYDQLHGGMHSNNLLSIFNITFPLSNYSIHYTLAKKIGFWDTCADAIGQDFHMTEKAFWKTDGEVQTVSIYAPFNQVNIQTGKGFISDIKARFWQAERHARGVSDVPYNINMLIHRPARWRTFVVFYQVLECFILPAIVPWAFAAMTYQQKILNSYTRPSPELYSESIMGPFYTVNTICLYISYLIYWIMKRRATTVLHGLQNESILRIFEYPILFPILTFGITVPSYIIAAFGALFQGREYVVAEKVISKKDG